MSLLCCNLISLSLHFSCENKTENNKKKYKRLKRKKLMLSASESSLQKGGSTIFSMDNVSIAHSR